MRRRTGCATRVGAFTDPEDVATPWFVNPAEGRFGIAALSVGGLLSSLAERPVSLIVPWP